MAGGDRVVACALARSIGKVRRWKLRLIGVAVASLGRALERLHGGDDGGDGGDAGDGGGEVARGCTVTKVAASDEPWAAATGEAFVTL